MSAPQLTIGVIADTHGLLRPEAVSALRGSDMILHAGDVDAPEILEELGALAPVFAVRGNADKGAWADALPTTEVVEAAGKYIYMLHDILQFDLDPRASEFSAVVYGHSHKSLIEDREGVLYINPGSAGRRRFDIPVTIARLSLSGAEIRPELIELDV